MAPQARNTLYEDIVNNYPDLICRYDKDFRLTFVNRAYSKWLGISPDRLIGTLLLDWIPVEERENLVSRVQALTISNPTTTHENRLILPDQTRRWMEWVDSALFDDDGNFIEYQGIGRNITQRKESEEDLRFHSEILQTIAEGVNVVRASDNTLVYTNPTFDRLFGYERGELWGKSVSILNAPNEHSPQEVVQQILTQLLETGSWSGEIQNLRKDGSTFWSYASVAPYNHPEFGQVWVSVQQDITERKLVEARQRAIIDTLPDLMFQTTLDGIFIDYHAPSPDSLAIPPEKFMGIHYQDVLPPEVAAKFTEALKVVAESHQIVETESQMEYNGEMRDYETRIILVGDNEVMAIIRDVTERKHAQIVLQEEHDLLEKRVIERTAELEKTKNRLEAIFSHSGDGIVLFNVEKGIQQANYAFEELLGVTTDAYLGKSLCEFCREGSTDILKTAIDEVTVTQQTRQVEVQLRHTDGTVIDVEISIAPINHSPGSVINIVCIIRDIRERKERERQLLFHASVQANMTDAVIATDLEFRIQSWNKAAEMMYGWTAEEVREKPVAEVLKTRYPIGQDQQSTLDQFRKQGWYRDEVIQSRKDGNDIYIANATTFLKDETGDPIGVVAVNQDITQRKLNEEALRVKNQAEQEMQSYLTALHDITIRLTHTTTLDEFYHCVVEEGLARFQFERMGLLLYDTESGMAIGTYGTDEYGNLIPEYHIRLDPRTLSGNLKLSLNHKEQVIYKKKTRLFTGDGKPLQLGSHAVTMLWDEKTLGWLSVDNGVRYQPISQAQLDILILYGLTVSTLLARKHTEFVLQDKIEEEHEFQTYLKALHHITIELTQIDDMETFYRRTVELGRERLGFQRLALFLFDETKSTAIGTYGTDIHGQTTDEHHIAFTPSETGIMRQAFEANNRFSYREVADLQENMQSIAVGWNAAAGIWSGTEKLGWLIIDNAIDHQSATKPLLDTLALYALTIANLLVRKREQVTLRESEERYRLITDNITDVIIKVNMNAMRTFASPSCYALLGYTPEELTSYPKIEIVHPDDREWTYEATAKALKTGESSILIRHRMRHKNGHYLWVEITASIVRHPDTNEPIEIVGVIRDITERKQSEAALQKSAEDIHDLYNNAPCGYHSINKEGIIVQLNDTELKWLCYPREEVIGKLHISDIMTPESQQHFQQNFPQFLQQGWINDLEFDFIDKNGEVFTVLLSATAVKDEDGQFFYSRSTLFDISDRKRAQDEIRASEERFRRAIIHAPFPIMIHAEDGEILHISKIWTTLSGYTHEDIPTIADWTEQAYGERQQTINSLIDTIYSREAPHSGGEFEVRTKSGEIRVWDFSAAPVGKLPDGRRMVSSMAVDVTTRKHAEQVLQQALAKEKELGELKSRFVSMASHEFRTPLASILAITETLLAYRERMTADKIDNRLRKIQIQVENLKEIIDDVLQLARIQARRVEFNPVLLDLDSLCRSVIDEFESRPDIPHIINYSCNPSLKKVKLDKKLMRQIINNLVSNAIKYSPDGKTINVNLEATHKSLIISVTDEGIGIPPEDLPHLFEPFHRASNVETISGTGLGLVIIKESVELHQGNITVNSQIGVGTTITISMPIEGVKGDDKNSDN